MTGHRERWQQDHHSALLFRSILIAKREQKKSVPSLSLLNGKRGISTIKIDCEQSRRTAEHPKQLEKLCRACPTFDLQRIYYANDLTQVWSLI